MADITVIGIGSTDYFHLNSITKEALNSGIKLVARTDEHEVIKYLKENSKEVFSLDYIYEESSSIEDVDYLIAKKLIEMSETEKIGYLVPGSPYVMEKSVELLKEKIHNLKIINESSAAETVLGALEHSTSSYKILSARDFSISKINFSEDLIIYEVDNEFILDETINNLSEVYPEDAYFSIVKDAGLKTEEIYSSKFSEYKREIIPNYQTSIVLFKIESKYDFSDLIDITKRLRGENGCPWDIKQTHESIRHELLEESYEVIKAIDGNDVENLVEELGDLIFQVAFHAQISYESGEFSIFDVTDGIVRKLIRRHPHVFGNLVLDNSDKLLQNWDSIKYGEKNIEKFSDRLATLNGMPADIRSYKIIDKVTRIGFEWKNKEEVLDKVKEEYAEVIEAIQNHDEQGIKEELGDLFFALSSLCHYLGYEPEIVFTKACDKFVKRFSKMEDIADSQGRSIMEIGKDELEKLWQLAKIE